MSSEGTAERPVPLVSLLARSTRLLDVIPHLHQHVIDVTGGSCSLLFEFNPRKGVMLATSGAGLEQLSADPWIPEAREATLVDQAFAEPAPTLVTNADHQLPDLAARLATGVILLLPLARGADRIGLLAVGFDDSPSAVSVGPEAMEAADGFLAAIEMFRLRQSHELQRDLRVLLDQFSATLAGTLDLTAGLEMSIQGANRLFGADRTSVWIHDRQARLLVLRASSDAAQVAGDTRVSVDDPRSSAAAAMRRARAETRPESEEAVTSTVTVPLRGCRRALGTIVFDGVRVETGDELDLLDRADELGRHISNAIESMQLLDDVLRSQRELQNAFDSIAHLIAVCDRHGALVHVNRAFAERLGLSREQLIGRPLAECVGPELVSWVTAHAADSAAEGQLSATCEVVDPKLKGPFLITMTGLLNHERQQTGTVIVARDITPQSKVEAEREELRRRLTQSEKLAALGQFVAGIAHELNNPLQGVLGHLELMRVTGAFPKETRKQMQTVYREADRAAKIVRNLLVFAGSRRLARRSVSLNAVLQKVLAVRAESCRAAGIEVVRHYDDKLPRVQSDPLLLHQVFLNMMINAEHAVGATGRNGRIEVTTTVARDSDRIVATVRDTGAGIAPDVLSHIFEPFYTTKEVGKGTGLGLAIAYGIVQEHGGHISASNHADGGAIFTVELPAFHGPARA